MKPDTKINHVKPRIVPLLIVWLAVAALWAISGLLLHDEAERGNFGDMFGAVNALFSGLAFATLIYTAWMQRDELALQREELAATRSELTGQKLQLQEQTRTFALQRFEDSFFALLRTHSEIVDSMDIVGSTGVTRSRDCFRIWYKRLKALHTPHVYTDEQTLKVVQMVYARFYAAHQSELGHYFRHLYHIIKFVKESPIEDKKRYTSLVRAQLSAFEHLMLFYNCVSTLGIQKFKPLVEEFELLENLPEELLLHSVLHRGLYDKDAYGEDNLKWHNPDQKGG
jgi:hypothetical protein